MIKSALLSLGIVSLLSAGCSRGPQVDTRQVTARRVSDALPKEDPASALWSSAAEHPAKLMVQDVTEPRLIEAGVELVRVRALHDGSWTAFRLEWDDPTQDLIPQPGATSDAAALQFPVQSGADVPDAAMGEKGKGVRIWYWKALWQDDAERAKAGKGVDRIGALYGNASIDHYPFTASAGARDEMERRYAPARAADNPMTRQSSLGPVQVLGAEGFGDVSPVAEPQAAGHGVWKEGRWSLTIARPLAGSSGQAILEPGKRTYVAFAIWDGSVRHSGSRKMRSGWIPLLLEGQ